MLAYAGLPPILEDPGEPSFAVPVPPPLPDDSKDASAGGASAGLNGTLPLPEENDSLPVPEDDDASLIGGAPAPTVSDEDIVDEGVAAPDGSLTKSSRNKRSYAYSAIGLVLVAGLVVFLMLARKKRVSNLPSKIKKF